MAHLHHLPYVYLIEVTFACVVFASHQLHLPVVKNEIKSLDVTCDANNFNTTVTLEHPFKGMVSAKDFSRNCYTYGDGTLKNTVTLSLPTSGCGLRLTSKPGKNGELLMSYSVFLSIQQDRHLHQIADQEIRVSCQINDEQFSVKSKSMVEEIEHNSMENSSRSRSGRMRQDDIWKSQFDGNKFRGNTRHQESIKAAKVWMEIVPGEAETSDNSIQDKLQVGESAKLIVKSTLPVDIGWKVVDCNAHDGLGDSSQKLLDEEGCPIDDQLMPQPSYGPIHKMSLTRYQEATSVFPAFKFPDRDRLHLTCMIVLCRGPCEQVNCNDNLSSNEREGKTLNKEDSGNTLNPIKIFNSVEVLAPTVNEYYKTKDYKTHKDSSFTFKGIPGDETLCISYHKIAIAFSVLGMLFLIGLLAATGGLLRARRSGNSVSMYTRSIFSSSSATGSSQYGSKLLHDHSSFGFSSRGMQYGRIL